MKQIQTLLLAGAAALIAVACDNSENTPGGGGTPDGLNPISARATAPTTDGSGTLTTSLRAFDPDAALSNLTLYFPTAKTGAEATGSILIADDNINHTVGSADFAFNTLGTDNEPTLCWQHLPGKGTTETDFYLTVDQTETVYFDDDSTRPAGIALRNSLWAAAKGVKGFPNTQTPDATTPNTVAFGTLKSRWARLTLSIELTVPAGQMEPVNANQFAAQVYAIPAVNAIDDADAMLSAITTQAWPTMKDVDATPMKDFTLQWNTNGSTATVKKALAATLVAPQPLPAAAANAGTDAAQQAPRQLLVAYNTATYPDGTPTGTAANVDAKQRAQTWMVDLANVKVTRTADSPYAATGTTYAYNAGEHITLTLRLKLASLTPGTGNGMITVTDYTATTIAGTFDTDAPEPKPQP